MKQVLHVIACKGCNEEKPRTAEFWHIKNAN